MQRSLLSEFSNAAGTLTQVGNTLTIIGRLADGEKGALGILGVAADPTSWLIGGVARKLTHVIINTIRPLKRALDTLFGDPGSILGFIGQVQGKGSFLQQIAGDVMAAADVALNHWTGQAAEVFSEVTSKLIQAHSGAQSQLQLQAMLTKGMGNVSGSLKETVMGAIYDFVGQAIQKAIFALAASWCSFGTTLARYTVWIFKKLADTANKIAKTFQGALVKCLEIGKIVTTVGSVLTKATAAVSSSLNVLDQLTGGKIFDDDDRDLSVAAMAKMPPGWQMGIPRNDTDTYYPSRMPTQGDYDLQREWLTRSNDPYERHFLFGSGADYPITLGSGYSGFFANQFGTAASGVQALATAGLTNGLISGPSTALPGGLPGFTSANAVTTASMNVVDGRVSMSAAVNVTGNYAPASGAGARLGEAGLAAPFNGKGRKKVTVTWDIEEGPNLDDIYIEVEEVEGVGDQAPALT